VRFLGRGRGVTPHASASAPVSAKFAARKEGSSRAEERLIYTHVSIMPVRGAPAAGRG